MDQALSDVRVLDLTQLVAGPYATKVMADLGADVLKIERPGLGDPARRLGPFPEDEPHPEKSGLFLHLNTNKRGITVDLETTTGRGIFLELAKRVDVVVESWEPARARALGLSYEELARLEPRLIVTSITAFGQSGPY